MNKTICVAVIILSYGLAFASDHGDIVVKRIFKTICVKVADVKEAVNFCIEVALRG